eukprot:TRINITY_DN5150_c0_g1_i35.p1 TRINITY_DN5150_c0_g1~~TRINITY_DN5150_c0_g1_i35.p1  ORF type:complete len:107 (-),score=16.03 TRINITY_DN5150_c0_g1_i35:141-461(-)
MWRCIFNYPQSTLPRSQWDVVIGNIRDSREYLSKFDNRTLYFTDRSEKTAYYICKAEHNIYLVIISADQDDETNIIINAFLDKLLSKLRFWGIHLGLNTPSAAQHV